LIAYYVQRGGPTERLETIDPAWLKPGSAVRIWADVQQPTADDAEVLRARFGLHPLAVEDAVQAIQNPKIETYPGLLYVVLHGINFDPDSDCFDTHDTDFFVSREFLITVHDGKRRSIEEVSRLCLDNELILREGTVALMHRIVDRMVDHYRPEVDELEERLDQIEEAVIERPSQELTREILAIKRDIASLRRIVQPQRDSVARLSRREFELIDLEMSYRFRDVFDRLVRIADDATIFHERVTGILDAHLASISNQLAVSSQRLASVATIFGTLTVITGVYGMNVKLPGVQAEDSSFGFWAILLSMGAVTAIFALYFRRKRWL
jgi:magnesium transporter